MHNNINPVLLNYKKSTIFYKKIKNLILTKYNYYVRDWQTAACEHVLILDQMRPIKVKCSQRACKFFKLILGFTESEMKN